MAEISFENLKDELGLILAILIVGGILYFVGQNLIAKIPKEEEILIPPMPKIEIDKTIFKNNLFISLVPIDEFAFPIEIGRENPFVPY